MMNNISPYLCDDILLLFAQHNITQQIYDFDILDFSNKSS